MGIYLDYAATTYTDKAVFEAMRPYFETYFGNTSSQHGFGREAEKVVMKARGQVAALICADLSDIFSHQGDRERQLGNQGRRRGKALGILSPSAVEHHAVLDTCKYLRGRGFDVTYLSVDSLGFPLTRTK